ncbi:MAG: hypothetical protein KGL39_26550 [Patescibacteria group bacterium]|nr:hypothetical protein [Patescibacteria group bacterium]
MIITETAAATIAQLVPVLFVAAAVSLVEQRRAGLRLIGLERVAAAATFWTFGISEVFVVSVLLNGGVSGIVGVWLMIAVSAYSITALTTIWGAVTRVGSPPE